MRELDHSQVKGYKNLLRYLSYFKRYKGKIVDFGTHEELLAKNKKYATLYKKQQKQTK